jgi:hypothetical protein
VDESDTPALHQVVSLHPRTRYWGIV